MYNLKAINMELEVENRTLKEKLTRFQNSIMLEEIQTIHSPPHVKIILEDERDSKEKLKGPTNLVK